MKRLQTGAAAIPADISFAVIAHELSRPPQSNRNLVRTDSLTPADAIRSPQDRSCALRPWFPASSIPKTTLFSRTSSR